MVLGDLLGLPSTPVALAGAALCFGLRFATVRRGWHLPVAGERDPAGREP